MAAKLSNFGLRYAAHYPGANSCAEFNITLAVGFVPWLGDKHAFHQLHQDNVEVAIHSQTQQLLTTILLHSQESVNIHL